MADGISRRRLAFDTIPTDDRIVYKADTRRIAAASTPTGGGCLARPSEKRTARGFFDYTPDTGSQSA
jgi:hypothetical protein